MLQRTNCYSLSSFLNNLTTIFNDEHSLASEGFFTKSVALVRITALEPYIIFELRPVTSLIEFVIIVLYSCYKQRVIAIKINKCSLFYDKL